MATGFGVAGAVSDFGFDDAKYLAAVVSSPLASTGALSANEPEYLGRMAKKLTPASFVV